MSSILLQLDNYPDGKAGGRFRPTSEEVVALLATGGYVAVAASAGRRPEGLWRGTQNGAESDSWSREPPDDVLVLGPGTLVVDGDELGYRSSDLGDVVVEDGYVHVVAGTGFVRLDAGIPSYDEVRVMGGGVLADLLGREASP